MTEVAVKANIFRRSFNKLSDYFKNIAHDYVDVVKGVVEDSKTSPLKAGVALSVFGLTCYAIKTNPTELDFNNRLCMLRQQMSLLPVPIHSSRAGMLWLTLKLIILSYI